MLLKHTQSTENFSYKQFPLIRFYFIKFDFVKHPIYHFDTGIVERICHIALTKGSSAIRPASFFYLVNLNLFLVTGLKVTHYNLNLPSGSVENKLKF